MESAKRRNSWDRCLRSVEAVNEERADPENYVLMANDGNQDSQPNASSLPTVTRGSSSSSDSTGPAVTVNVHTPAVDNAGKKNMT